MSKPLSLSDSRFSIFHKTHGLVYKVGRGYKVYSFINRPHGKPVKVIALDYKDKTISEALIKANADIAEGRIII